jgi:two-component sensor histidine kinase/PAS domain-containing protein
MGQIDKSAFEAGQLQSFSSIPLFEESLELKLSRLNHGDHTCSFYGDTNEQNAVLTSFVKTGLAKNNRCICVIDDQSTADFIAGLEAEGIDVRREREQGALLLIDRSHWRNPGPFEIPAMAEGVKKLLNQASGPQWKGLWVSVDMTWTLNPDIESNLLGEWEAFWNNLIQGMPAVLLCQYNRRRIPAAAVFMALKTHPLIVASDDVHSNFYYEPPELLSDSNAHSERSEWMMEQFQRARVFEAQDVQRLKEETTKIQREEAQKKIINILESITDGFIALDLNWRFTYINRHAAQFLERIRPEQGDLLGENFWEKFPNTLDPSFEKQCHAANVQQTRIDFETYVSQLEAWFEIHLHPSREGLAIYFQDITIRKQMEESLRQSLHEKQILLQEIHHRVKNNLQVVASLLGLQARGISDPELRILFKESQNRVRSMALIHEKLYRSETLADVDLNSYIQDLVAELVDFHRLDKEKVTLNVEIKGVSLPLNLAISCALILHELVSNSLKHAFPRDRSGTIHVILNNTADGEAMLNVSDDGVGLPAEVDIENTTSLGLKVVNLLVKQIDGTLEVKNHNGTTFTIRFPVLSVTASKVSS